jgi:tetratricopeptide (TPR) repeat protein
LEAAREDPMLYGQLAALRKAAGDFSGAANESRRQLALLPTDAEAWSHLGSLLIRQRNYQEALAAFEHACRLDPQDVVSREARAQSLAALGRGKEAIREFRRLLAAKPRLGLAWLHLGQTLEKLGDPAEAEKCFQQAASTGSDSLAGVVEFAGFWQSRGRFDAAARDFKQAIKLDPANPKLQIGAGQNLAALKRYSEALPYSAEAVRLDPGFAEAHLLYGTVLGQQGRITEAEAAFREALRLMPELLDARLNLGLALMNRGEFTEARVHVEQVLQRSPTNSRALKYLHDLNRR